MSGGAEAPAQTLIGRDRELARIREFLTRASGVLLLEGEAGIGKTALLHAGVDAARSSGWRVLLARPAEAEATFAFAGIGDLLRDEVGEELVRLPTPQRRALAVALLLEEAGSGSVDPHAVGLALLAALSDLGRAKPVLVAVDDVQWLDPASAATLAFAARRLSNEQVAFLLAARSPFDDGSFAAVATDRLRLEPLTPAALRELLSRRVGCELARPLLVRIHAATRGNPLHALELARSLPADLPPDAVLPVPPELRELLGVRLRAVSPDVRRRLAAAAALSQPTEGLVGDLSEAVAAGLVEREADRIRFTHPLLASILYEDLPANQRHELHLRLADIAPDQEQRAWHLARGTAEPSEEIATALDAAAERAAARGAPETAAALCRQARRLTPPDRPKAAGRRALRAATFTWAAGDASASRKLLRDLITSLPPSATRAQARQLLVKIVDDIPQTLGQLERAIDDASGDLVQEASARNLLARQLTWGGDFDGAIAEAQAAAALAERAGSPAELAVALSREAQARACAGEPIAHELLERAVALEQQLGDAIPVADSPSRVRGVCAMWDDDLEAARSDMETVERRAASRSESWRAIVLNTLAEIELRRGQTDRALRHVAEAEEIASYWGVTHAEAAVLASGALVKAVAGQATDARAGAERALALMRPAGYDVIIRLAERALGFLELSLGNAADADAMLAPLLARSGIGQPTAAAAAPDEIEALVELGRIGDAEALLAEFDGHVGRTGRSRATAAAARCRAIIFTARGDIDAALSSAQTALGTQRAEAEPLERGRAFLALGSALRRGNQRRAARDALQSALALFEQIGAPIWAERCRAELARIGGRRPYGDELTPSERRVAELVATGRSNPEVAQALFLSRKTVERHVSQALRKLDVRNRTELAAKLRRGVDQS
jgi:DNA-binding NarL/FixJ family response regulator